MESANQYAVIAGAFLALVFFYVPGLSSWYGKLPSDKKQLVMLAALFVAVGGRFALSCFGKDTAFACTDEGAWDALVQFVISVVSNAGVYKGTNYLKRG